MSTPTPPTDHDEYEALAVGWAVHALEPADLAIFEAHWAECERCTQAAFAALDVATELAYAVPDVVPPARLRGRVRALAVPQSPNSRPAVDPSRTEGRPAADGAAKGRHVGGTASGRDGSRSGDRGAGGRGSGGAAGRRPKGAPGRMARAMRAPGRLACALAAAVLVVGSAIATWQVTRPAQATDRIAALSDGGGTVATVVVHQHGADVVTDVLPPNTGRGSAYYLWGAPAEDGGTPQVVGTFEVTTTGLHSYPLHLTRSLDGYPVLAISEERAGSTPSAPSSVLGKGGLGS